jgi:hypothetical protein
MRMPARPEASPTTPPVASAAARATTARRRRTDAEAGTSAGEDTGIAVAPALGTADDTAAL